MRGLALGFLLAALVAGVFGLLGFTRSAGVVEAGEGAVPPSRTDMAAAALPSDPLDDGADAVTLSPLQPEADAVVAATHFEPPRRPSARPQDVAPREALRLRVRGTVVDEEGRPLAEASITLGPWLEELVQADRAALLRRNGAPPARTDRAPAGVPTWGEVLARTGEDGIFELEDVPPGCAVWATAPGRGHGWTHALPEQAHAGILRVGLVLEPLHPNPPLAGRVLDPGGVLARTGRGFGDLGLQVTHDGSRSLAQVDGKGRFRIESLGEGSHVLQLQLPWGLVEESALPGASGIELVVPELELDPEAEVPGDWMR